MSRKGKNTLRRRNVNYNKLNGLQKRINRINDAISRKDLHELRRLAKTGPGLVNDGLRRLCWPLLLHSKNRNLDISQEPHKDEYQISLDVVRSFVHFPKGLNDKEKKQKQDTLREVIVGILRRHPNLSYYQGFHDVCTSLLEVLGKEGAIKAGENIAMFLLRDAMHTTLDPIMNQLDLLGTLLRLEDAMVYDFLNRSSTMPYFCMSWIITWCSHDVYDFSKVTRLFDFFIASNPLMALYLSARVVISRRKELLLLECDSAIIHGFLSKFPQDIEIDELISRTIELYRRYPPYELQLISGLSLEKTSSINLYDLHWLSLKSDDIVNYSEANKILLLPPLERKPAHVSIAKSNSYSFNINKMHAIILLFVAVLIASRWFMSNSVYESFGL